LTTSGGFDTPFVQISRNAAKPRNKGPRGIAKLLRGQFKGGSQFPPLVQFEGKISKLRMREFCT
jgi:hypothetical protein